MSEELKPCPFCGDPMQYSFDAVRHVKQGDCVIGAYSWGSHDAVERWNRRAHPAPTVEPVAWCDPLSLKFAQRNNGVYVATSAHEGGCYSEPLYSATTISALVAERDKALEAFRKLEDKAQGQGVKGAIALATAKRG